MPQETRIKALFPGHYTRFNYRQERTRKIISPIIDVGGNRVLGLEGILEMCFAHSFSSWATPKLLKPLGITSKDNT